LALQDIFVRGKQDRPATFHLKRELKERYPSMDMSTLRLKKVILIAKSRLGYGQVSLRTGENVSQAVTIAGDPKHFQNPRKFTFHRVVLENSSRDNKGGWQLLLTGHIVARQVTLVLERSVPPEKFLLRNRSWATAMEGERSCDRPSSNAPDGWGAPQNICSGPSVTNYAHGYRPIPLFVRPDVSSFREATVGRVTEIVVVVKAVARNRSHHGHESASFGIEIGRQTYKSSFSLAPPGISEGGVHRQTLHVHGSWKPAEIANSRMWIKADQASADFEVQSLQLLVSAYR
jgi:hypothetical protein